MPFASIAAARRGASLSRRSLGTLVVAGTLAAATGQALAQQSVTLLNVSYDPTRELYVE